MKNRIYIYLIILLLCIGIVLFYQNQQIKNLFQNGTTSKVNEILSMQKEINQKLEKIKKNKKYTYNTKVRNNQPLNQKKYKIHVRKRLHRTESLQNKSIISYNHFSNQWQRKNRSIFKPRIHFNKWRK